MQWKEERSRIKRVEWYRGVRWVFQEQRLIQKKREKKEEEKETLFIEVLLPQCSSEFANLKPIFQINLKTFIYPVQYYAVLLKFCFCFHQDLEKKHTQRCLFEIQTLRQPSAQVLKGFQLSCAYMLNIRHKHIK